MLRFPSIILLLGLCHWTAIADGADIRREIQFPDMPGYVTLKCDFHMHTVFSDGTVWPSVRVAEAWRQGLDAVAITDHVEYQPHKEDLRTKHNRPFELAQGAARSANVLLPRAAEITRETPPGHFNALFLQDVASLDTEDFLNSIEAANKQQAFVFWNHHGWKGPERGRWLDVHTTMYDNKWLHGMELCNGSSYYPEAHAWCLEKGLTMIGSSDIHQPDLRRQSAPDDHRTMTLVLAKERSLVGIREALDAGRTVVWFNDQLIAREEILEPFFHACVQVAPAHHWSQNQFFVEIRNSSDVDMNLQRAGAVGPQEIQLPARSTSMVRVSVGSTAEPVKLNYSVANLLIAPETPLPVVFTVSSP